MPDISDHSPIEEIYARLRSRGVSEEVIDRIKSLGGPENVNWDAIQGKFDPATRHLIGAKLLEAESGRTP